MSFNPSDYYYACTCRSEDPLWKYKAVLKRRTDDHTQPSDEQYVFFGAITDTVFKDRTGLNGYPSKTTGSIETRNDFITANKDDPKYNEKYSRLYMEKKLLY
jgi:hypothetical protein